MNSKVEEHLVQYCKSWGWNYGKAGLKEALSEAKVVWEGDHDKHRWFIFTTRVVEVAGMFIRHLWGTCTGDNSMEDAGFEWDWDFVCEVEPKEVTTTVYEPVKEAPKAQKEGA